eukprot:TRINITY_DN3170_c0_g1_i1.p1 TRINITY_DN3170_c0_g1~~TRINITY_DN3170_c0_g1_i1.p1  ORF type:complete len:649 (-),score=157.28 TRINITY_DN3170_c0_g1_i1:104-2050(-)
MSSSTSLSLRSAPPVHSSPISLLNVSSSREPPDYYFAGGHSRSTTPLSSSFSVAPTPAPTPVSFNTTHAQSSSSSGWRQQQHQQQQDLKLNSSEQVRQTTRAKRLESQVCGFYDRRNSVGTTNSSSNGSSASSSPCERAAAGFDEQNRFSRAPAGEDDDASLLSPTGGTLLHPRPQKSYFGAQLLNSGSDPASPFHGASRLPSTVASATAYADELREDTKSAEPHYMYGSVPGANYHVAFGLPHHSELSRAIAYHHPAENLRFQSSASVGPVIFGAGRPGLTPSVAVEEHYRRAQSLSPSLFIDEQSSVGSSVGVQGGYPQEESNGVLGGALLSRKLRKKKEDKKKHGSFKIWHRNASEELQCAYNAIYGLPLYGSVAFIGRKPFSNDHNDDEIQHDEDEHVTHIVRRFEGSAHVDKLLMGAWDVVIDSAGKDDGDYAKIVVNGHDYSENKRGFNLAILTPETGEVKVEAFDTHGLPEEAEKLATFISQAPAGSFLLGAVRDDGAKFLGDLGRAALRLAGVRVPKADDAFALREVVHALPPDRTRVLLTVCAKANAKNCAKVLLQNGWDIHTRASHTMNTPLHDAVYQKNTDIAIVLLDCGADASLENKWGETPENIAQKKFGFASLEHMIMSSDRHIQSVIRFIGLE